MPPRTQRGHTARRRALSSQAGAAATLPPLFGLRPIDGRPRRRAGVDSADGSAAPAAAVSHLLPAKPDGLTDRRQTRRSALMSCDCFVASLWPRLECACGAAALCSDLPSIVLRGLLWLLLLSCV
jgi:hypothetical protein